MMTATSYNLMTTTMATIAAVMIVVDDMVCSSRKQKVQT
jgi:hypothetical protein